MDSDNAQVLRHLLNNTATEEDIAQLKQRLTNGEIFIGGNVNQSVIIFGNDNTIELPAGALDRLNARSLLGDLDRDLTGPEMTLGLERLEAELPIRAPILRIPFKDQARRLKQLPPTRDTR